MYVVLDLDSPERRVEDLASPAVSPVEPTRVAPIQAVDRVTQSALAECPKEVVVRRHDAELVQLPEVVPHESRELVDDRDVVAVVAENPLLGR